MDGHGVALDRAVCVPRSVHARDAAAPGGRRHLHQRRARRHHGAAVSRGSLAELENRRSHLNACLSACVGCGGVSPIAADILSIVVLHRLHAVRVPAADAARRTDGHLGPRVSDRVVRLDLRARLEPRIRCEGDTPAGDDVRGRLRRGLAGRCGSRRFSLDRTSRDSGGHVEPSGQSVRAGRNHPDRRRQRAARRARTAGRQAAHAPRLVSRRQPPRSARRYTAGCLAGNESPDLQRRRAGVHGARAAPGGRRARLPRDGHGHRPSRGAAAARKQAGPGRSIGRDRRLVSEESRGCRLGREHHAPGRRCPAGHADGSGAYRVGHLFRSRFSGVHPAGGARLRGSADSAGQ